MNTAMFRRRLNVLNLIAALAVCAAGSVASASYFMNKPDGTLSKLKEGAYQPDLSPYRTKLDVKILDRRWVVRDAFELANQAFFVGQTGFSDMVRAAFPLAHKSAFQWVTHQEAYWGARTNMEFGIGTAHMGISMVHGPYWTLKALELANRSKFVRDRGEHLLSNKDVMMGYFMPTYWKRIGSPLAADDAQPPYLMYASGDPHFTGPYAPEDTFSDSQSGKEGKWGVPEFFLNSRYARFDPDKQERFIDLGGEGMAMKRSAMWIAYMLKSTHAGISPSSQGFSEHMKAVHGKELGFQEPIPLLGNDGEEGTRGMVLVTTNANRTLALKSELVADEAGNLGGVNPYDYEPAQGLRYFPHRIWPSLMMMGDLPERQWTLEISDPRSLLFDQAALLLGLTEYYHQSYRFPEVFSANPPVDGGLVERDLGVVARGLANMVVKNILAMHTKSGLMISEWQPKKTKWWLWKSYDHPGPGETVSLEDSAYAIRALREYVDRLRDPLANPKNLDNPDLEPELTKKAMAALTAHAEFLLKVQRPDGAFCEFYNVVTGLCVGDKTLSGPQFWAIGALLSVYHATGDERYAAAARKTWNHVNTHFWHEPSGLFRTRLDDDTVLITPMAVAGQLWAYREIMFATPIHLIEPLIDRWTRWWVQTVDMTGLQQSEKAQTGELCHGVCAADFDNDGIPHFGRGDGKFGIAPVYAAKIAVNIGGPMNQAFAKLAGETHDPEMYGGKVAYRYAPKTPEQAIKGILLPEKLDVKYDKDGFPEPPWVKRDKMLRFDGLTYPLPPAIPFKRGSDLTGKQIVEMNCAHCHGYTGEGITGIPWKDDSLHRTRDDMFEVPKNGRFTRLMPEWGRGLGDELGAVLTDEEIYRAVDYVQSKDFQRRIYEDFSGIAHPDMPPKDVYFYISLSYVHGKKTPATQEDIKLIMDAQERAIKERRKIDIMALLREAEQGRTKQVESSSDPQDSLGWLTRLFRGTNPRKPVNGSKVYAGFYDVLSYRPALTAEYDTFKNVRPLDEDAPGTGVVAAAATTEQEEGPEVPVPSAGAGMKHPR